MAEDINKPNKGLHLDSIHKEQPEGTYRFALNAINETEEGDVFTNSNEESNEICSSLPAGYIPIGQVYIGDNETAIFSVSSDESTSEIGVQDGDCNYTTHVNGDLGFKLPNQIDATYRLRKGCEKTVYFVDGKNNRPRHYIFGKEATFQTGGQWDAGKFDLQRRPKSIPIFDNIEVLNSGGNLEPGSYSVAIQYLDENLNPTEWLVVSNRANVYNDDTTESYVDIRGSINSDEEHLDFPTTDKAIEVLLTNLDTTFLFYRLGFIEATNGTGFINNVRYTEVIPTTNKIFIYTGTNYAEDGTEAEIAAFSNIINSAEHVEQIENRLILSNTTGSQVDLCKLQKYASKIKTDVITKPISLNTISEGNPKSPTVAMEAVGYMPGEIYSLGIVFVTESGETPVYHIPGKNVGTGETMVFEPGENVYPMSTNNVSTNSVYSDNSSCENYWGVDSEGDFLKDSFVRHHRFPTRRALGIPLVTDTSGDIATTTQYQVQLSGTGTIDIPCSQEDIDDGICGVLLEAAPFRVRVEYTVDGVTNYLVHTVYPDESENPFAFDKFSTYGISSNIVIVEIREYPDSYDDVGVDVTDGLPSPKGVSYTAAAVSAEIETTGRMYNSEIFGLQFSGIELPPASIVGEDVIGYYIVANERTELEKTILDSGVLTPSIVNDKYVSHGLLGAEVSDSNRISKKYFGLIHPEHKFNGVRYPSPSRIRQEGEFLITDRKKSITRYQDVMEGTSHDPDVHKGSDNDGWSLKAVTRDSIVTYNSLISTFNIEEEDIENIFYLDALQSKNSGEDDETVVYNISADNKVGIIELKEEVTTDLNTRFPYVIFERDIADSYSAFRTLPYYKISQNIESTATTAVFGGDVYITPMRYVNTLFWDNRIARRRTKKSFWQVVAGVVLVVVGAVLAFFTAGATLAVVGAGLAVLGAGAMFVASGIKQANLVKAYSEDYLNGLRETILDDWIDDEFNYRKFSYDVTTPYDDEVQWAGDCVTDLWFESQVNMSLRYGIYNGTEAYLNAPGRIEDGNSTEESYLWIKGDKFRACEDKTVHPKSKLDNFIINKLLQFNTDFEDNKGYIGHPLGELYNVNPDYQRLNKQKTFNHLPLEYDCCSDCIELFPHRNNYSEQSYQEELSDNFKLFLPNNYRDIEGETGEITDTFKIKNNLYIHTEEALWHLPQSIQERVTGDIVSFIGTGSFFDIPPRKIMDEDKASGGTQHKWATVKTKHGVFFVSENEKKVYKFDGNKLETISEHGISKWFKKNGGIQALSEYYKLKGERYPYDNNPSNPLGTGYLSTYDTEKERIIVTKRDGQFAPNLDGQSDFEICINDGQVTLFEDYQQTIDDTEALGWTYKGIEDCRMKFEQSVYTPTIVQREVTFPIANEADIHVFYDTSGSFDAPALAQIDTTIDEWLPIFQADNPGWVGNLYKYNDSTEQWVNYASRISSETYGGVTAGVDIVVISFCNESSPAYHSDLFSPISNPSSTFLNDYDKFVGTNINGGNAALDSVYTDYNSIKGIHYPIVFPNDVSWTDESQAFVLHSLAALKGVDYTVPQVDALIENLGFEVGVWDTLKTALQTNPYPDDGLENYGWLIKEDRFKDAQGNVISTEQFTEDIEFLLQGSISTEIIDVEILVESTEELFIDGVVMDELISEENSWTMSYSLKGKHWVSWHSYMPNFYFYIPEKFYSWNGGTDNIWEHGKLGEYQNFYGTRFPYIIEYVSASAPLKTKIWDNIILHTEAKKYNADMEEYTEERFKTFNKAIFYNSRQCSGELELVVKDTQTDPANYMSQQVIDQGDGTIIIDRNEGDWGVNDIRDIRIDYSQPMFDASRTSVQSEYYIDKILNTSSLDVNKSWEQLESFRDNYLVVRLIFDNFDDVKLIMNYSEDKTTESLR